jgi:hypothetical protein
MSNQELPSELNQTAGETWVAVIDLLVRQGFLGEEYGDLIPEEKINLTLTQEIINNPDLKDFLDLV